MMDILNGCAELLTQATKNNTDSIQMLTKKIEMLERDVRDCQISLIVMSVIAAVGFLNLIYELM